MQVNFDFKDHRGEHSYYYEFKAVPRVGDFMTINSHEYKIVKVLWNQSGMPTCKLEQKGDES